MKHILIVDDEKDTRDFMARALELDYEVTTAANAEMAMQALESNPDIVLMLSDIRMPGADGIQLMKAAKAKYPKLVCILLTAFGSIEQAVSAMQDGADDFITKPVDLDQLELRIAKAMKTVDLENEVATLRSQLDQQFGLDNMIGTSPKMLKIFNTVRRVAQSSATVLLQGPNGTGKDLVAHAIHNHSPRAKAPFIAVNCGAIPATLIESELFGYEKGAFTGANSRHSGAFESANFGTIFLDEIGELPMPMQVKLLRVLENRAFMRVGGNEEVKVDLRVIAASNRDLKAMVAKGEFREDLFYRLNVVDITLPALKDRPEDIPLLVARFIKDISKQNGRHELAITPAAMRVLERHSWPGNVRELRNVIERMVVLTPGDTIDLDDIPESVQDIQASTPLSPSSTIGENEKAQILATVETCKGNLSEAARRLGISRRTIYRKLETFKKEGVSL